MRFPQLLILAAILLAGGNPAVRGDEPESGTVKVHQEVESRSSNAAPPVPPPQAESSPSATDEEDAASIRGIAAPGGKSESPAERIEVLEQRVNELSKLLKAAPYALPGKSGEKSSAAGKKPEDEWTDVSSEKWTVKLGGHVQLDYITWPNADPAITGPAAAPGAVDYFEFRRLRLVADGTGYGVYDFRLQMTLEPETVGESPVGNVISPDVKDAYFSMNEIPLLGRFRIGNFFVPFSLEQVTNDTNTVFLERSIPSQGVFAPDREVGMAFYNCTDDKNITWTYGAFLDSISEGLKERIDSNQGYRLSGRLTWLPYYDEPSNGRYLVFLGAGILHTNDQDSRVRFRSRPQIHEGPRLIDSGVLAADEYTTANLEFATVMANFSIQSEAYVSQVNMNVGDQQKVFGGYFQCSYFLTGENRNFERFGQHGAQFGRATPYTNFFLTQGGGGWGGWELKTRMSYLDLNEVNKGNYHDLTTGINWYWSDRVRVLFDWIHPITTADTTFGNTKSDILAMRFDFNW
jgi:phosphate-selective porin OprO/OprP